MMRILLTQAYR